MSRHGVGVNIDNWANDKNKDRDLAKSFNNAVEQRFFQRGYNAFGKDMDVVLRELKDEVDKYVTNYGFDEQNLYKFFKLGLEQASHEETIFTKTGKGGK